jgi:hypothetical protein
MLVASARLQEIEPRRKKERLTNNELSMLRRFGEKMEVQSGWNPLARLGKASSRCIKLLKYTYLSARLPSPYRKGLIHNLTIIFSGKISLNPSQSLKKLHHTSITLFYEG